MGSKTFVFLGIGLLQAITLVESSPVDPPAPTDTNSNYNRLALFTEPNPLYTISRNPKDVSFYFFKNPEDVNATRQIYVDDPISLLKAGFIPGRKTVIITHGFRSNLSSDMPQTLKNAFLAANQEIKLNYNIIVTSWGPLSTPQPPALTGNMYGAVTFNVLTVGERVGQLILFLRNSLVLSLKDLHLVGHSLGSHVSGLAGRYVYEKTGQKVARITGLDPAGPLFFPPRPDHNIGRDNAHFVDIIHTNAGTLGDITSDGHADFWPNGGVVQPNCTVGDFGNPATIGRCSHWYAYQFYAASIQQRFFACPCAYAPVAAVLGKCNSTCADAIPFGFNVPTSASGEYFARTPVPVFP